jgi:hypothetical protein
MVSTDGQNLAFHTLLTKKEKKCPTRTVTTSLELISLAYQPWYSVFLSQQISQQYFSA